MLRPKSVDFEIIKPNGLVRHKGVLPVVVKERTVPARRIETMGVVYDVPEMNVTQILFGSAVTVEGEETLSIKINYHGELDGSEVGDGIGQPVPSDEDSAPATIPIRPGVRSEQPTPTFLVERPVWEVSVPVHPTQDDQDGSEQGGRDSRSNQIDV